MRIAPLADVKARLSTYVDECGADGPIVITQNGKAVAVFPVPLSRVMSPFLSPFPGALAA
jgi:prevent-host-death family protein